MNTKKGFLHFIVFIIIVIIILIVLKVDVIGLVHKFFELVHKCWDWLMSFISGDVFKGIGEEARKHSNLE